MSLHEYTHTHSLSLSLCLSLSLSLSLCLSLCLSLSPHFRATCSKWTQSGTRHKSARPSKTGGTTCTKRIRTATPYTATTRKLQGQEQPTLRVGLRATRCTLACIAAEQTTNPLLRRSRGTSGGPIPRSRYSVYLLYWYKKYKY